MSLLEFINLVGGYPEITPIDADFTQYPQSGANNNLGLYSYNQRQMTGFYKNGLFHFGAAVAPQVAGPTHPVVIVATTHDSKQEVLTTIAEDFNDYHMDTSFVIDNAGDVYMFQEEIHNALIKVFKADDKDDITQGFTEMAGKMGSGGDEFAYPTMSKLSNGNFVSVLRNSLGLGNDLYNFTIKRANSGAEDWNTLPEIHFAQRDSSENIDRLYPFKINGSVEPIGGYHYFNIGYRNDLVGGGGIFFAHGAFKIPDADLVAGSTYRVYNLDGDLVVTLDGTNPMTNEQRDQLMFIRYQPDEADLSVMLSCISPTGTYYSIINTLGDPVPPAFVRDIYIHNGASSVRKSLFGSIVGFPVNMFHYNGNIYIWVRSSDADDKIFSLYRCNTDFSNIQLISDVTINDPNNDFGRMTAVTNVEDVPVGDNLIFMSSAGSGGEVRDYCLVEVDGNLFTDNPG